MNPIRLALPLVAIVLAPAWSPCCLVCAQAVGVHVQADAKERVLRMTVCPAPEPRPALKYQLLPPFLKRTPGNAAVYYGKVTAEQRAFFSDKELWDHVYRWLEAPLDELRSQEVLGSKHFRTLTSNSSVFRFLRRGARCQYCDWQLPIREGEYYTIILPEVQQTRMFARLLLVRARLQIASGQFDQALETLQTGYALGRHVAEGETFINGLVGVAICKMMSGAVQDLIQQPDAPNLYWALTMLPRPFVNQRKSIEVEMNGVYLQFEELRDLDRRSHSPDDWRRLLFDLGEQLRQLEGDSRRARRPEIVVLLALKSYPAAKQALIERGYSPDRVEGMPVAQALLIDAKETYDEIRDAAFKRTFLPYWQGKDALERPEELALMEAERHEPAVLPLAAVLLPAVRSALTGFVHCDRKIAVLRAVEALRMYAAQHGGRLPERLTELPVPAPLDPIAGRPFDYRLREKTAVIKGPPLPGLILNIELKIAKH